MLYLRWLRYRGGRVYSGARKTGEYKRKVCVERKRRRRGGSLGGEEDSYIRVLAHCDLPLLFQRYGTFK